MYSYKTPKFYGPQLLYQMVKVYFYFFAGKVLLLESHHKIMKVFPWIFRIFKKKTRIALKDRVLVVARQNFVYPINVSAWATI